MNISSPRLLSPSRAHPVDSSLVSTTTTTTTTTTEIQDSVSSQSGHTTTENNDNYKGVEKKNLKTEYKSNFTPFDQYVYNEVTDSFVKQHDSALSPNDSHHHTNNSNQKHSKIPIGGALSPTTLDAGTFEPNISNGGDHENEPWYKEVMRRNEKANEYRFKSEVGHSSPLLKASLSNEDLNRHSPCGNDSATDTMIRDQKQANESTASHELKHSFRFTPSDYKRDHFIAHMANNNNFNLPKEQQVDTANSHANKTTVPRRRPPITSAGASRSAAQIRARSQSSRRQPTPAAASKASSPTKSNQSTPTRSVPVSRPAASTTHTKTMSTSATKTTLSSVTRARPATSTANGVAQRIQSATTTSVKRAPIVSKSATRSVPAPTSTSRTSTASPANQNRGTSARSGFRAPASSDTRTISSATTSRISTTAPRSPVKKVSATPSNRLTTATARPQSSVTRNNLAGNRSVQKTSASTTSSATTAVKSIKTPKAMAAINDARKEEESNNGLAAGTAVATAGILAGGVAVVSAATNESDSTTKVDDSKNSQQVKDESAAIQLQHEQQYATEEPNLIFTTTEAGNMLADEIAQAEKVQVEAIRAEQRSSEQCIDNFRRAFEEEPATVHEQPRASEGPGGEMSPTTNTQMTTKIHSDDIMENNNDIDIRPTSNDETSEDLVNGLANGLVSAEDRFDSSDRDVSNKTDEDANQSAINQETQDSSYNNQQQSESYDDQPYSIMPTTFDNKELVDSKHDEQQHEKSDSESEKSSVQSEKVRSEENQDLLIDVKDHGDSPAGQLEHDFGEVEVVERQVETKVETTPLSSDDVDHITTTNYDIFTNDDLQHDSKKTESEKGPSLVEGDNQALNDDESTKMPSKSSSDNQDLDASHQLQREVESEQVKQADHDDLMKTESDSDQIESSPALTKANTTLGDEDSTDSVSSGTSQHEKSSSVMDMTTDKLLDENPPTESTTEASQSAPKSAVETTTKETTIHLIGGHDNVPVLSGERQTESYEGGEGHHHQVDSTGGANNENIIESSPPPSPPSSSSSDNGGDRDESDRNELLMKVNDLADVESRKKQEMARKSVLARDHNGSMASSNLHSEMLLSADQLTEQLSELPSSNEPYGMLGRSNESAAPNGDDMVEAAVSVVDDGKKSDVGEDDQLEPRSDKQSDLPADVVGHDHINDPLHWSESAAITTTASITTTTSSSDETIEKIAVEKNDREEKLNEGDKQRLVHFSEPKSEDEDEDSSIVSEKEQPSPFKSAKALEQIDNRKSSQIDLWATKDDYDENEFRESGEMNMGATNLFDQANTNMADDDIDSDEHLKLSNHLTNSDDELILEPRNGSQNFAALRTSSSRYNEGAGLGLITQEDKVEADSAVLGDGLSAEIIAPTMAEKRVEESTSKLLISDISQAASFIQPPKLTHEEDYDDEEVDINQDTDPIGAAATLSPSSSVAEELLHLNRELTNATSDLEKIEEGHQRKSSDNDLGVLWSSSSLATKVEADNKQAGELVAAREPIGADSGTASKSGNGSDTD